MKGIVRIVHGAFVIAQEEKDTGTDLITQAAAALDVRLGWKHKTSPLLEFYGKAGFSGPGSPMPGKEYYTSKPPWVARKDWGKVGILVSMIKKSQAN
jgi:hypothetical protein